MIARTTKVEREHRGWRIVANTSPVTRRTRHSVWSPNGVNMRTFDTDAAAESFIDTTLGKKG